MQNIAVVGSSGSGKSTSLENLDPRTTYIINCLNKALPFKGSTKQYNQKNKNIYSSTNSKEIVNTLLAINTKRPEIKTIVLDDVGFVMQTEFFEKALESGYTKFSVIGQNMFNIINTAKSLREDLTVIFMFHSEPEYDGVDIKNYKIKTIGKILDSSYEPAALFPIVLYTHISQNDKGETKHSFVTNKFEHFPAKSPKNMFADILIPNDMKLVLDTAQKYFE